uniref:la-related protein 1B-like isoform X2 n=1 Tax=Erigeron canadensis TaxID=72917 RepID=UPI001CB8EBF0|nr:la-related protein 1B-like isoform X2 [Erigeron canadensis]
MTADSSTVAAAITHSGDDGGVKSPTSAVTRRSLPVPWAQAVRGSDSVPGISDPAPPPETPPENNAAGGLKKSAWNKPSAINGVIDGNSEPLMGAASWPALSESTRPGFKLPESSSKPASDGSVSAPVVLQQQTKQAKSNANSHHTNSNHMNQRNRSMKRAGAAGGAGTGNGNTGGAGTGNVGGAGTGNVGSVGGTSAGYIRPLPPPPPPMPPPFPLFDVYGNLVPPPPPPPFKGNTWSPRSVGVVGQDQSLNRNPARRNNNFGPRPVNNGGRRDHHDRDWRGPRSHQMGVGPPPPPPVRGFIRPHPGPASFIPHQPIRPYGPPMGYGASYVYLPTLAPEPFRGVPPLPPPGTSGSMFMPRMDSSFEDPILKQIEYYFSDDNLVKDNFLRSHMDDEGWVPISLIAGFRRVQLLTNDIQMITKSLRDSTTLEIQGDKLRRRTDWKRWVQSSNKSQGDTSSHEANENSVEETSLQNLTLEDGPSNEKEVAGSDSSNLVNGEVTSGEPCF